jgi:prevent-host-death family protein
MESVNFREFRKNLAGYLRQARQGGEIIVTSRGEEVARLVPPAQGERKRRQLGTLAGRIWIADDFDETPPEVLAAIDGDLESDDLE